MRNAGFTIKISVNLQCKLYFNYNSMLRYSPHILLTLVLSLCLFSTRLMAQSAVAQEEWKLRTRDGARLYVTEFGVGDTVLVIHGGFGAEHGYLLNAFMPLANEHRFVLYDQRGSLRSPCKDSLITLDRHLDDIEDIRQRLHLEKLTVVTHSMGGFIIMNYMQRYPGRVKKLVLLASPPAKGTLEELTEKLNAPTLARWNRPEVIAELKAYGLENQWKDSYTDREAGIWDRITFGAINLHHVKGWSEIKGGPMFYSAKAAQASIASVKFDKWNFIEMLRQQKPLIYIIHGADDYLPYSYHDSWKDSVGNVKFRLINDAGHCLWIDNFKDYKGAMTQALKD